MKATFRDGTSFDDVHAKIGSRLLLLRHDTCGARDLEPALRFAAMEHERGIRATYFIWDDLPYFFTHTCAEDVKRLRDLGHGIGLHYTAIPKFLRDGTPPHDAIERALAVLRRSGDVTLAAGHGDPSGYTIGHAPYQCFTSFDPAANEGIGVRWPMPLVDAAALGIVELYIWGSHTAYLSDSRGIWTGWRGDPRPRPFERVDDAANLRLAVIEKAGPDETFQWLAHPVWWNVA